jgi:hypothetical protein
LKWLGDLNLWKKHFKEAIQQTKEAIEIRERLGDTIGQADCSNYHVYVLASDGQLNAAEAVA